MLLVTFCIFLFFTQIYEAQPDISTIFQICEAIPLSRLLSMIMVISLPPVCNKAFFTQGLSVSDLPLYYTKTNNNHITK